MKLRGKSVLITGGTGDLGSALATRFLAEGAQVVITLRTADRGKSRSPGLEAAAIPIEADVTSEQSVAALFRKAILLVRRIDILVNTVGGFLPSRQFTKTTLSAWEGLMKLNVTSAFLCTREFLRQKGIKKYGRIFNISAQTALRPTRGRVPYSVSKAAVASFTVALAEELKGTGVTVNAFAPSILRTVSNLKSMPGADTRSWVDPSAIADQIVTLCGPGGDPVSGAVIPVFGGI